MKYDAIYGFFKSLRKSHRMDNLQMHKYVVKCVVRGKKITLELSLIQGFSCFRSNYVLSLVVPPGIEPGTQGFSVLCSTN